MPPVTAFPLLQCIDKLKEIGHNIEITPDAIGVPAIVLIDQEDNKYAATDQKTDHYVSRLD